MTRYPTFVNKSRMDDRIQELKDVLRHNASTQAGLQEEEEGAPPRVKRAFFR